MKICIMGVGKMGTWLAKEFAVEHEVSVLDNDMTRCRKINGVKILERAEEIVEIEPQLLINSVSLQNTVESSKAVIQFLPRNCLLCDVASVKADLPNFYREAGFRFVSVHPMFGPTFSNLQDLKHENAVIVSDSDNDGKQFFRTFFIKLGINIFEYSFKDHDTMMAYSLTLPFVSSLVFSSCVDTKTVPGTTFKRHLDVARGLLSEDDFLLAEIIFNPYSLRQLEKINSRLNFLWHIIKNRDTDEAVLFFDALRNNIGISVNKNSK